MEHVGMDLGMRESQIAIITEADGFRLSQESAGAFRLELAAGPGEAAAVLERLHVSLLSLGWPEPAIEVCLVPADTLAAAKPEPFRRLFPGDAERKDPA